MIRIPEFDKTAVHAAEIIPLVNQLRDRCDAAGIPVVVLVTYRSKHVEEGYNVFESGSSINIEGLNGGPHLLAAALVMRLDAEQAMKACEYLYRLPAAE